MSQFTATAPNGQVLVRNTKSHTYNYAVIIMETADTITARLSDWIARNENEIAKYTELGTNVDYVARITKENTKNAKTIANVADTWYDIAWRRDLASAQQEASKMQEHINKGNHNAAKVMVVETTQTK
jgi:hypothetical protein